ncbi:MAG: Fur family transcriptional regulator [Nitrospinota bacterium]
MSKPKEIQLLKEFLVRNNLKSSARRELILEVFLKEEGHISAEELYEKVKEKDPSIGISTVYRTMKILLEAGLAQQRRFSQGEARYEHEFSHRHHDHLICTRCQKIIEFEEKNIEALQERIAQRIGFTITSHRLDLFGVCADCNERKK